jgi:hypothetical protein
MSTNWWRSQIFKKVVIMESQLLEILHSCSTPNYRKALSPAEKARFFESTILHFDLMLCKKLIWTHGYGRSRARGDKRLFSCTISKSNALGTSVALDPRTKISRVEMGEKIFDGDQLEYLVHSLVAVMSLADILATECKGNLEHHKQAIQSYRACAGMLAQVAIAQRQVVTTIEEKIDTKLQNFDQVSH